MPMSAAQKEAKKYGGGLIPIELAPDSLHSEFIMLTPDLARVWLERNYKNRPLRSRVSEIYARDMGKGKWTVGTNAIAFSTQGTLMNGQHRLEACCISGVPIPTLVIYDLPDADFKNLDTGADRTRADRLSLDGEAARGLLGGAMGWLHRYEKGTLGLNVPHKRMTPADEVELLERHPDLRESVGFIKRAGCAHVGNKPIIIALHYICHRIDSVMADYFYEALATGTGMLSKDEPVYQLFQQLSEDRGSSRAKRMTLIKRAALIIKAWNLTVRGSRVKILAWRVTEEFPEIQKP